MTIYVDDSFIPYRGMKMCHLMTDGPIEELHDFANMLGMKRSWFQDKGNHPHYDVSKGVRVAAVNLGARSVSPQEIFRICVTEKRKQGNEASIDNGEEVKGIEGG